MTSRRVACWTIKVTRAQAHARVRAPTPTHRNMILVAFPLQQWFHERASLLRYTYLMHATSKSTPNITNNFVTV